MDSIRRQIEAWPFLIEDATDELLVLTDMALRHDSYANEQRDRRIVLEDNERLEFLGDAVLELMVREHLYINTNLNEGDMTQKSQNLISNNALAAMVRERCGGLGSLVQTSAAHNELSDRMLAGAFEAVLGAIYLCRGIETTRKIWERIALIPDAP